MFRNLTLFRIPASTRCSLETLPEKLPAHAARPIGPQELASKGFTKPHGFDDYSQRVGDCILFAVAFQEKILPAAVVNAEVKTRIAKIAEQMGVAPNFIARKNIKDEVVFDLLKQAFTRTTTVNAYIDLRRGWLVVDSATPARAEAVNALIRQALGSFLAIRVRAEAPAHVILTDWLRDAPAADFDLGSEFTLADPVDNTIAARFTNSDPAADEIRAHLDAGMQCNRLGLVFQDRLTFTLDTNITVRKLKLLSTNSDDTPEDAAATFALYSGQIGQLLDRLACEFEIVEAA